MIFPRMIPGEGMPITVCAVFYLKTKFRFIGEFIEQRMSLRGLQSKPWQSVSLCTGGDTDRRVASLLAMTVKYRKLFAKSE